MLGGRCALSLAPDSDCRTKLDGADFERVVAEILANLGRGLPGLQG